MVDRLSLVRAEIAAACRRLAASHDTGNIQFKMPMDVDFVRPDNGLLAKVRQELRRRAEEAERRHSFRDRVRELLRDRFGGDRKAFYEAAGLDRRLFSKMVSYEGYAPSKETAIAVALAARLTLDEARDFLHVAGYALSDSIPADIVYAACFRHQVYERAHVRALLGEFSRGRIATQIAL
jgi:hypothetical protein